MSSQSVLTTISPITSKPIHTTSATTSASLPAIIKSAHSAQVSFFDSTTLDQRIALATKFLDGLEAKADILGKDITESMGRPIQYTGGEIKTAVKRGRFLVSVASEVLSPHRESYDDDAQLDRWLEKEPLGIIFVIFAWNYPYLILINSLIPALIAGNALLLKPSPQIPTIPASVIDLLISADFPNDLVQAVHSGDPSFIAEVVQNPLVAHTVFTGSFPGGLAVARASASFTPTPTAPGFKTFSLELGGNDPAYVRADVDPKWAAEQIADGALFNSGQSCCAIERVYVHEGVYDKFVEELVEVVKGYTLGDPRQGGVMLGPVVSTAAASRVRAQISEALSQGAKSLTPPGLFDAAEKLGEAFVRPEILVDVTHDMEVMTSETFGPVIPVMRVGGDEEAIRLMNDSELGLTASVWTRSEEEGRGVARGVQAGTVFVNRCDYPDPTLAWTGHKNSGRGHALSRFGFDQFVNLKSYHVKKYTGPA
ncbi:Aldehyde/histidinol dehydrogenase [Pterulicium gracile]|uniref:Aldehyde/histidinol dehydrogenase n=1 Tax=Pterulicium gracile TaxID=1884261 RepID=A0A5C3QSP5_9AGAR|nr:Aldehyde/histidinol dehydrogenase [Pterula gracilis]